MVEKDLMNPGPATSIELTKLSSFKIFPISRPISLGLFLVIFPNIKAILHVRSPFSGYQVFLFGTLKKQLKPLLQRSALLYD